ncbi:MAG: N-acetylmuramoyl-L-alanine amidase [Clostridiales bacterium]|nr:N-acetylmuramoyl-L-alanine amidase [Clostridiales bacterium]
MIPTFPHGGADPGKVGINGALEKDINLEIALLVQEFLEQEDIRVIMTRETADGLYDKNASNKKVDDMKKRIAIMEKEKPDAVISIHQNSYHEENVSGPQVFYYNGSIEGKKMADIMQGQIVCGMHPEKERVAKENGSYYLLKKTSVPIVIVECGFLSNSKEAEYLCTPLYREKMAWNIHLAVLRYLNENTG